MKKICLREDLIISKLVFGTDKLIKVIGRKNREKLLFGCLDFGITHFDTAPLYGFGMSECHLRSVLAASPETTITSKIGLYPPGRPSKCPLQIYSRKLLGKIYPKISTPLVNFSVDRARLSIEKSRKNLGRDHLDLLLIHDPNLEVFDTDEWLGFIAELKNSGLVRSVGVDGAIDHIADFLEANPNLFDVIQCRDSLAIKPEALAQKFNRDPDITFGYIADALIGRPINKPLTAFREGLLRFENSAVIATTTSYEHLAELCFITNDH